jgi:hypothetical protein
MAHFNFAQIKANLALTKRVLPIVLAKQAENHFTEAFAKGGLDEYKWSEVNRRIRGTREYRYPSKPKASSRTSPILVRTGNLRRKVSRSIKVQSWPTVKLQVDTGGKYNYAEAVFKGTSNMPARPNLVQTKVLTTMQNQLITTEVDKIWNV